MNIKRQLLETFFSEIKHLYNNNKEFQKIVKDENNAKFYTSLEKQYTPFNVVNQLLLNSKSKSFIWKHFNFSDTVVMPTLPEVLLYGVLSDFLHADQFNKVIISNFANKELKEFMSCLSKYYSKSVVEFDEIQAESGGRYNMINVVLVYSNK